MKNEFRRYACRLERHDRLYIKFQIYMRLYRRSIWMIGYPLGVILFSAYANPSEKIVIYSMAAIVLVYARLAVKFLKW